VTFFSSLALNCGRLVECLLLCLNGLARPDQVKDQSTTSAVEAMQLKELISLKRKKKLKELMSVCSSAVHRDRSPLTSIVHSFISLKISIVHGGWSFGSRDHIVPISVPFTCAQ
jgi:hypothetical protein